MQSATATYHPLTMYPTELDRVRATALFDRKRILYERKWHSRVVRYWTGQAKRILVALSEYKDAFSINRRFLGDDWVENLFERNKENEKFIKGFREIQKIVVVKFGQSAIDELIKEGLLFDIERQPLQEWLATDLTNRAKLINPKTAETIQGVLNKGIAEGEGAAKLSDRIRQKYPEMSRGRGVRIARTEVGRASNTSTLEGYKQAGAPEKEWLSARDADVRDLHMAVDGQVVPLTEDFIMGDGVMMPTPCMSGVAHHDINCRCRIAALIPGESPI